MKTPILFVIFNRLDTTQVVFEQIRLAKPEKLYVAADGPRLDRAKEAEVCQEVRRVIDGVDWECEVYTQYQDENLGCKLGVYKAIDWFFENEPEGIILEDDVVPLPQFFTFCELSLLKYREQSDIFTIQGFNQFGQGVTSDSYYYSRGFYAWGWATWRDRWKDYKLEVTKTEIKSIFDNKNYPKYVLEIVAFNLDLVRKNILDTWDYQMLFQTISSNSFNVVPYANLTSNIGVNGAHSKNNKNVFHDYGIMDSNLLDSPELVGDHPEFNDLLFDEFKQARVIFLVKRILLALCIYEPVRRLVKRFT